MPLMSLELRGLVPGFLVTVVATKDRPFPSVRQADLQLPFRGAAFGGVLSHQLSSAGYSQIFPITSDSLSASGQLMSPLNGRKPLFLSSHSTLRRPYRVSTT